MAEYPTLPADWYADPADPTFHRWWDGTGWTDRLRPGVPLRTIGRFRHGPTGPPVSERFDFDARRSSREAGSRVTLASTRLEAKIARAPVVDRRMVVPNPSSTVAVVLGAVAAVAFTVLRALDLSLSLGFVPGLIALAVACMAAARASRTGAGIMRSALAFVLTVPLTGFAIWAFAQEILHLVRAVG